MKTIYFVRHGQTEMNKKELVQGRINSDLTALGQMQAYATGQYFMDEQIHFNHVFSSPALRARETGMLVCPYHKADIRDELNETSYGSLEGIPISEFQKMKIQNYFREYGGESREDVESRIRSGMKYVLEHTGDGETSLVIGHGSSGFRFAYTVDPKRAKKLRKFGNCLIYKYTAEDGLDSVHLESIELGPAALVDPARYEGQ